MNDDGGVEGEGTETAWLAVSNGVVIAGKEKQIKDAKGSN